jgi:hypothetical protein
VEIALAVWGAVLSTVLALRQVIVWWRDRPMITVDVRLSRVALGLDPEDRDPRSVVVTNEKSLQEGVSLAVGVVNHGERATQVVSVVFEGSRAETQVVAVGLPAVLEPETRLDLRVQPEWVAMQGDDLRAVGVLDALGRKHTVSTAELRELVATVDALPTRVRRYKRKEDTDPRLDAEITAFQAHDRYVLIRRDDGRTYEM